MKKYFVYILKSINCKKGYVGHTDNLNRRLAEHNLGKGIYTSRYRPWKIIYKEDCDTETGAISREKYLKTASGRRFLKNKIFNVI